MIHGGLPRDDFNLEEMKNYQRQDLKDSNEDLTLDDVGEQFKESLWANFKDENGINENDYGWADAGWHVNGTAAAAEVRTPVLDGLVSNGTLRSISFFSNDSDPRRAERKKQENGEINYIFIDFWRFQASEKNKIEKVISY